MTAVWTPRRGRVVCVGETMAALAADPPQPLTATDRLRLAVAGAESNVAMYLADHGIPAVWLSAVGDDPFGRRVRDTVAAAGVDVTGVRIDPDRPTGLLVKDVGSSGTRVHYYRQGSAASRLGPELLAHPALDSAALLHLTGITPALSASCGRLVAEALARPADARPYAVSFDVNHRPALWPDASAAATVLRDLADRADITFVGLDEAQALWGDILTADDVRDLLPGPRILVVKDGANEARAYGEDGTVTVPALKADVVDSVGAGDAFAAGFLAGLLDHTDLTKALWLGHLTAVSALAVPGDHGTLPDRAEISRLLSLTEAEWAEQAGRVERAV